MNKVIKKEQYKIKVDAEVFTVNYPSHKKSKELQKEFSKLSKGKDSVVVAAMEKTLVELGLDIKFLDLDMITSADIGEIFREVLQIKK